MSKSMNHLLSLVKVELEDLVEDLKILEQAGVQRFKDKQITEYVLKENFALFELEIHALQGVQALLSLEDWKTSDPEKFLQAFRIKAKEYFREYQYPEAMNDILERKLHKVAEYLA